MRFLARNVRRAFSARLGWIFWITGMRFSSMKHLFSFFALALSCTLSNNSAFAAGTCPNSPNPKGFLQQVQQLVVNTSNNTAQVTLKNNGTCSVKVGLASYRKYDEILSNQTIYDWVNSTTLAPGQQIQMTISLPSCAAQVDVFWGDVISDYSTGAMYSSPVDRLIAAYHTNTSNHQLGGPVIPGSQYCTRCPHSCTAPTPTPKPTKTPTPSPTPSNPVCDAGGPYSGSSIPCSTSPQTVQLSGAGSSIPGGGTLSYAWSSNCPGATFDNVSVANPKITLVTAPSSASDPAISCNINLTVTSSKGTSASCSGNLAAQSCSRDCAGTINGGAVVDRCGVCSGNGQSCVNCNSVNIQGSQLAIDNNANAQRDLVLKINRELDIATKNAAVSKKQSNSTDNYIVSSNTQANAFYKNAWTLTYTSFPPAILTCTSTFCVNVSTASSKAAIKSNSDQLLALAKNGEARVRATLAQAKRNKAKNLKKVNSASAKAKKFLNQASVLSAANTAELGKVPGVQSSCSN